MQNNHHVKPISVPSITDSSLCPVRAISNLLTLAPEGSNFPLFQFKQNSNRTPLTNTKVRRPFSLILSRLDLAGPGDTLHTVLCSGATFAFNNNVACSTFRGTATGRWIVCGGISQTMLILEIK